MKKTLFVMMAAMVLASCSITRAGLETAQVQAPVLSTTIATLNVESSPITSTYVPTKAEQKALSLNQLIANAQYQALKEHGTGDVMVKVSYMIDGKKGLLRTKVKKIVVAGYPATYACFREPTAEDRENVDTFFDAGKLVELRDEASNTPIIIRRKK